MLHRLMTKLKGTPWFPMLLLIAALLGLIGTQCVTPTAPVTVDKGEEVTVEGKAELRVVELKLLEVIENWVPVEINERQPLRLEIVQEDNLRLHFRLEIDSEDYPPGNDFKLEVMAIPRQTMANNLEAYPEVVGLTGDRRLIIKVDDTEYIAASPFAFSVAGIDLFAQPVSVSISVDISPEVMAEEHGIIIYHESDGTIEHFPAQLTEDSHGFLMVTNSDSSYRCCRVHAHCSSGPACFKDK